MTVDTTTTAMKGMIDSDSNLIIGDSDINDAGMMQNSVLIGHEVGEAATASGSDNVIVGNSAARYDNTYDDSVVIGHSSGNTNDLDGSVLIGRGVQSAGGTNEIVIGCLTNGNGDNTVTIGKSSTEDTYLYGTIHAEGGQIQFPSTPVPSTDTNTLDFYAEGTFTPTVTCGGSSVSMTFVTNTGRYTRIGNVVNFEIEVYFSNKGGATGDLEISGLPFTTSTGPYRACSMWMEDVTFTNPPVAYLRPNDDCIRPAVFRSDNTMSRFNDTELKNDSRFVFTGMYTV